MAEEFDEAIAAWKESIVFQPSSPDTHTSTYPNPMAWTDNLPLILLDLASAYIISPGNIKLWSDCRCVSNSVTPVSRPDLALHHLE